MSRFTPSNQYILKGVLKLGFPRNSQFSCVTVAWYRTKWLFFAQNSASFSYQYETNFARNCAFIKEMVGNKKIRKYHDFLQILREIAFVHQCAKTSKFRAIFTRNVSKSLRNVCTIFGRKFRLETIHKIQWKLENCGIGRRHERNI